VNTPVTVVYTYTATDICGNVGSCQRIVTVVRPDCPLVVSAGGPGGSVDGWLGTSAMVPVSIDSLRLEIGAFDLLMGYDRSAVSVLGVEKGSAIGTWEYFTYRLSESGSVGLIRLVAVADLANGVAHPPVAAFMPQGAIANVKFAISADRQYANQSVAVSAYHFACTDNTVQSRMGDMTLVPSEAAESCESELKGKVVPGVGLRPVRSGSWSRPCRKATST
jgi:hypothetical protein